MPAIFIPLILAVIISVSTLTGRIVSVSDGDTITLLTSEKKQAKIRLSGVDCPEKAQAYGSRAKQFTSDLVYGKDVTVQVSTTDKYGRTVGEVFLPDGRNLNKELVRAGYAWHYKQYSSDPELAKLETEARNAGRGLWQDPNPTPPWEFRHGKKSRAHPSSKVQSTSTEGTMPATGLVVYNTKSHKYHCPTCSAAQKCTQNCITIQAIELGKYDGVPCGICGGRCKN